MASSNDSTSDEDSAPLAALAKKRRQNSPPVIPFVPPQEVAATYVVRPRPSSPPPETFELETGSAHVMKRDMWLKVFGYLTQHELCTCMAVSRTWNRWCMDKRFWTCIKLAFGKSITASALSGVVRRQPLTLDLSHTNITQQQLAWFLSRLPRLRDLILEATTFATVSAFTRVTCPPLQVLDLSWSEKITDQVIEDLLKPSTNGRRERPPGPGENPSRLRFLTDFRLAGCEIGDSSLRSIKRYLGCLTRLDLSYNILITDQGVANLLDSESSFHKNIKRLKLTGCSKLSDMCFEALKNAPKLDKLDVRKCVNVTTVACMSLNDRIGVIYGQ
jgi:F-box/leucine-rich repeat protein 10/11